MNKFLLTEWQCRASIQPGGKGSIKELYQYGDELICVRYRYNKKKKMRIKTVELVVDIKHMR